MCKQFKNAVKGVPEHQEAFRELSITAGETNVRRWTKQGNRAQRKRKDNIEAMDIYMAEEHKGKYDTFPMAFVNYYS